MAMTNNERAAAYRERKRKEHAEAMKPENFGPESFRKPEELRVNVALGAKSAITTLAEATGTARGILVERAIYEYCKKYEAFYENQVKPIIAARPLCVEEPPQAADTISQAKSEYPPVYPYRPEKPSKK